VTGPNGEVGTTLPQGFVRPRMAGAVDGQTHFGYSLRIYATTSGLLGQIAMRRGLDVPPPDPPYTAAEVPSIPARVYDNCWITDCPEPNCADASFIWLATPLYMCAHCFNEYLGGRWRQVLVPKEEDRQQIEAVLALRQLPKYRTWNPEETVDELVAQNLERGDAVPEGLTPEPEEPV
jgi:hypothetical protein